jgi:hypothetical protein
MKQRWSVQNHIKTVHAIAVCNLVEMAMGLVVEGIALLFPNIHCSLIRRLSIHCSDDTSSFAMVADGNGCRLSQESNGQVNSNKYN